MKKWVRVNFSKKIREDHTIQKQISCKLDDFHFDTLSDDIKYYDSTEIKISLVA